MGDGHAGAAKTAQGAQTLDRIADRFHAEGQIYEIQPKFLKRGIVNRRGKRMLDWVTDDAAELGMCVDVHRFESRLPCCLCLTWQESIKAVVTVSLYRGRFLTRWSSLHRLGRSRP